MRCWDAGWCARSSSASCSSRDVSAAQRPKARGIVRLAGCLGRAVLSCSARFSRGTPLQRRTSMMNAYWVVIAGGVVLALLYGWFNSRQVLAANAGNARMQEISGAVQEGAQAYLNRQYRTIAIVGVIIFVILLATLGWRSAVGCLVGAVLSGAAGYIGMNVSVRANVRTAQAAREGLASGLDIALQSGGITGLLGGGVGG